MKLGASDLDRLRSTAEELLEQRHLPGLAIGVVQADDLAFAESFGYADIEAQRPNDPNLRHRIGSVTKTMTAMCVMALIDEGRLSLDSRIVELLPDIAFHGYADAATVRHLLTHTSGIGEAPTRESLPRAGEFANSYEPVSLSTTELYEDGILVEVPPGTKWAYANHGYGLLGEIIMRAESLPLDEILRRRLFDPLGMSNSDVLDLPHADLTTGYHRAPDTDTREFIERTGGSAPEEPTVDGHNIRTQRYQYIRGDALRAAGGVQTTLHDMTSLLRALLRGGAGVMKGVTFDDMVAPQWCLDERLTSQGYGFVCQRRFGRRAFAHAGGIGGGWTTMFTVLPDDDLALVVQLNLASADIGPVESTLLRALVNPSQTPADATYPADERVFSSAPGTYQCRPGTLTNIRVIRDMGRVHIEQQGDHLLVRSERGAWKDGVCMLPADAADASYFALDTADAETAYLAFALDDSGFVVGINIGVTELIRASATA